MEGELDKATLVEFGEMFRVWCQERSLTVADSYIIAEAWVEAIRAVIVGQLRNGDAPPLYVVPDESGEMH